MKSILEEASTIMKAIEKGWVQAGKPREFSVKVLEEPVKNFIGMTTKSAKIGLFFDERTVARKEHRDTRPPRKEHPEREHGKQARPQPRHQTQTMAPSPAASTEQKKEQKRSPEQRPRSGWNEELIAQASSWLTECLRRIDKGHISFTTLPKQSQLVITFKSPIVDDEMKQRTFFRSSSYLLMQALRSQSKKSLRGLTILFTNAGHE